MEKTLIPTEITKALLIKNGYKEMVYGDYCAYMKEVEGFWLSFKYDMSNTPNRDWYLHVDSSERCTVAGCDVQYVHQAQQLMEIFDVKLKFHV